MYAVTAWMVQPLTCSLVGTKMEKLQTNKITKTNNNNKNDKSQQLSKYNKECIIDRSQFRKAKYIFKMIEKNKQNGTPRKKDEANRKKCQAVIKEFLKTKQKTNDNSLSKDKVLLGSKADKQTHRNTELKVFKTTESQQVLQKKFLNSKARRLSTDIIEDNLSMALVNDIDGQIKPVDPADWPMIETKISDVSMKYLLDTDCSIPHYDAGEICRGFLIIQCKDQHSKEFVCRCVETIRNAFYNMSLALVPAVLIPKILDNPIHFNDCDQEIEQPLRYGWTGNPEELAQSNCQENQDFQLPINYFDTRYEVLSESLRSRDHMSSLRPSNCVPYEPNKCSGLTAANIDPNSVNLIDARKRKKMKSSYRYNKHYLRQMAFVKKLSPCQQRQILKAKRIIRKYERVFGSNTQKSHLQRQQKTLFANEFPKTTSNSFKYYEPEVEEDDLELGENSSGSWNDFEPNMQQMPMAGNIFDYSRNYDGATSGFSLNTNNNFDSEMQRMPEFKHFESNLESLSNMRDNTDFNSCYGSKFKGTDNKDLQNIRNFRDPNGPKFISNFEKTFFQSAPEKNYPTDTTFNETRGNSPTKDLRSQFAPTPTFFEQNPTANLSNNFNTTEKPYCRRNNFSTEPQTSSSIWRETPTNNANCFEQSAKIALEKRIYECLNALSEGNTTTEPPSFKREMESSVVAKEPKEPQTALVSYTVLEKLKQKSNALRKRTNDHEPTVEVISLTDDSEDSDIVEIKSFNMEKAKSEYFQALDYLKKMELRDEESVSKAENLQIQIYRHKVKKYEKMFGTTKRLVKQSTTQQTDGKRKSRWSSNTKANTGQYSRKDKVDKSKELDKQQGFWKSGSDCFLPAREDSATASAFSFPNTANKPAITGWYPETKPESSTSCAITNQANTDTDLKIAIIDRNQDDGKISREAWLKIEKSLLEQLHREMHQTNNTNIGMFDCTYWRYDIKIIECENIESLNFIKRFIHSQDIYWPNTQFDVIPARELPRRSIVKVWIPPPILNDMTVLKLLKAQNSKFYSLDWTLINSRESDKRNGKNLYISISPTSLERLRKKNGEIRLGTNRLQMILPEET